MSDLKLKTWEFGCAGNLRSDSTWQDDRYNPTKYSHPHRYDSENFKDQEYRDFFGGTIGEAAAKDAKYHTLGLFNNKSPAMLDLEKQTRSASLKEVVKEVSAHKEQEHAPKKGHGQH